MQNSVHLLIKSHSRLGESRQSFLLCSYSATLSSPPSMLYTLVMLSSSIRNLLLHYFQISVGFSVCMAQSKFRINIYVLVSSKTIRCPSNSPFSSSTHIAKRHETCKDPAIRFKFFIQEPVGNKPWVCSQTVGILDNPGALKKTLLVKNSHAQLLHSPLQWQD